MNIFQIYQKKIKDLILDINKNGKIEIPANLDSIGVDIPPNQFKSHISTNVAMILFKINETHYHYIKPFLVYLHYLAEDEMLEVLGNCITGDRGTHEVYIEKTLEKC